MLMVISPAKSLDFESPLPTKQFTQPALLADSQVLINTLTALSPMEIERLMKISPALANLNFERVLNWNQPFTSDNARPCVFAFTGDVYQGLAAKTLSNQAIEFLQKHLRILSGLYGLLRPLDLIQPYRLEMGTKLANSRGRHLYDFWGDRLVHEVHTAMQANNTEYLVNLASNEYFKAVNRKTLKAKVITPIFKDKKSGEYKVVSFHAKKARGMMARFIAQQAIAEPEGMKDFSEEGYVFSSEHSTCDDYVFLRDTTP